MTVFPKMCKRQAERGFTLVELTISLAIVAFLIAGVLKGYALYQTAQGVTSVAQIKSIFDGARGFQKTYWYLPGDIKNAQTRIPNCSTGNFCASGDGNGRLTTTPDQPMVANEGSNFFLHLYLTDFLPDVGFPTSATAAGYSAGHGLFASGYGSNLTYRVGFVPAGGPFNLVSWLSPLTSGHYIGLAGNNSVSVWADASALALRPNDAQMIDKKIDDGLPNTGTVRGAGAFGTSGCILADSLSATGNLYNTTLFGTKKCAIYALMQ